MISLLPVSSRSLRSRSVDMDSCVYRDSAVLPFFTSEGEVPLCMLVLPQTSRLYFFSPREAGPRIPLWGTVRFRSPVWSCSDGSGGPSLRGLWHYDPDWLLRDARFAGMEIVPLLRKTNCCAQLPLDVKALYYHRDLSRVRFAYRGENEQVRLCGISTVLPSPPLDWSTPEDAPPRGTGSWRLDPIWMRTSRPAD